MYRFCLNFIFTMIPLFFTTSALAGAAMDVPPAETTGTTFDIIEFLSQQNADSFHFLIALGIILFIAEMVFPSFGLIGVAGIVIFTYGLHGYLKFLALPALGEMEIYAILGITAGFMAGLIWIALRPQFKKIAVGTEAMIGDTAFVVSWSGKTGHVLYEGEIWKAESQSGEAFKKEDVVCIRAINGLKLVISHMDKEN